MPLPAVPAVESSAIWLRLRVTLLIEARTSMSENDRSLATVCWITTAILATFLALLQLAVMISLMASRTGFRVAAPLTLAASLIFGYLLAHHELLSARTRWTPIAITLSLLAVSIALSAFFYDLSWDGEWYQQTGIIRIASDWNPLTDPMREFTKHLQLWVRHYAKGPWYIAAAIYQTTGRIELGKFVPWIALAATFLATLAASLDAGLRRKPAIATAALIAINPVVTSELPTYLVDGIMFGFLIVAVAATISALRQPRTSVIVTGIAASIVAINAKFTGLVFLCFALAAIGLWCLFKKREQLLRFTAISIGTLALGACIWGYNPYITNTIHRHQPFYPVLGSANFPSLAQQGRDGIDRYETPKNIMGRNRFLRFGYATFGRPGNQPYRIGLNATLMWPFDAHLADLYCYTYHETRVAGFGPWFSGCLLLSVALAIWLLIASPPTRWLIALLSATIVASLLISPQLWWPRYGPQLWLLPIVPLIFAMQQERSGLQRKMTWSLVSILLVNALIVATIRIHWEASHTIALRHQLQEMHASQKQYRVSTRYFSDSARVRLTDAGIPYQDLGTKKLPQGHELVSVVEGYPDEIRYLATDEK